MSPIVHLDGILSTYIFVFLLSLAAIGIYIIVMYTVCLGPQYVYFLSIEIKHCTVLVKDDLQE